jgi:hypothetical protein
MANVTMLTTISRKIAPISRRMMNVTTMPALVPGRGDPPDGHQPPRFLAVYFLRHDFMPSTA